MEENRNEEISLRELIEVLLKRKTLIIAFVVVAMVLSLVYSFFVAKPAYRSEATIAINVPSSIPTRFGSYDVVSNDKNDLASHIRSERVMQRVIEELRLDTTVNRLRSRISIFTDKDSRFVRIVANAGSPLDAKDLVDRVVLLYLEHMSSTHKSRAIDTFTNSLSIELDLDHKRIEALRSSLDYYELELSRIDSKITLQKALLDSPLLAAEYASSRGLRIEDLTGHLLLEEISNPLYTKQEDLVFSTRASISDLAIRIAQKETSISDLAIEKSHMDRYYISRIPSDMNLQVLDVFRGYITIESLGTYVDTPISPNKKLNVAISVVLGGMMGVFIAFFVEYWKSGNSTI